MALRRMDSSDRGRDQSPGAHGQGRTQKLVLGTCLWCLHACVMLSKQQVSLCLDRRRTFFPRLVLIALAMSRGVVTFATPSLTPPSGRVTCTTITAEGVLPRGHQLSDSSPASVPASSQGSQGLAGAGRCDAHSMQWLHWLSGARPRGEAPGH